MAILDTDLLLVNRPSEDETYKYTFGNLKDELPPGTVVSENPPTGDLQQGLLWFDSSIASLFIWYDDGDTAQWVDVYAGRFPENDTGGGANVIVGENAPTQRTDGGALQEGDLWWNNDTEENGGGRMFVYYDDAWVDTSLPGGPGGQGGASVSVGVSAPGTPNPGDLWWNSSELVDGGGRMYIYYQGQWVDASILGGGGGSGFSGDYNDLTNKPNIPPEFNLDDGSVTNDIIHWAELGSVQEISTTDIGPTSSGNAYTNVPAVGGSGQGLTCNVVRRRNTGVHEVYVAFQGSGYSQGDTVTLDLGYDPGGATGSTGITCTIDQVNTEDDGWVARPGIDYFVSSGEDSVNTGVPQFMLGGQFGGDTITRRIDTKPFPLVLQPIGDKTGVGIAMYGNRNSSATPSIQFEAGFDNNTIGELLFTTADDENPLNIGNLKQQKLNVSAEKWEFQQVNAGGSGWTNRATIDYNGTEGVTFAIINGEQGAGGTKKLLLDWKTVAQSGNNLGNSALRFGSANGKYNFLKINGTSGYQINAEAGSAGFILPADAAEASNYDAEGEYIGPVVDQAQDIRDALTALKAAAADNGTDLAGLKSAILSALTAF